MVQPADQPPLPDPQIAAYARQAGFSGSALATIVAVILAESGGDPDSRGDISLQGNGWGPSIGLAQVRCRTEDIGTGRPRDCSRLTDPGFNLRSAWSISGGGTNFRPWSMFTNNRYRQFLDRAWAAVAGAGKVPAGGELPTGIQGLQTPGEGLVERIVEPIGSGLARIALIGVLLAGGVALVAAGGWKAVEPVREKIKTPTELEAQSQGLPA